MLARVHARAAPRSCRRAATPVSSAGRCRCTARSCSTLRRLADLGPVDTRAGQVTAQAGVTIATLQAHAREAGWDYGVDLAARDSATVGGTIATNAGGMHVLRHGATRRQVARRRSGARRRTRHPASRRPREGQHRLRPRRAALRERRNARRGHRGAAAPRAPARRTSSSRCSPSTTSSARSTRVGELRRDVDALRRGRAVLRRTASTSCATGSGSPRPFAAAPSRVRAGRSGRAHRSDRRARRRDRRARRGRRRRRRRRRPRRRATCGATAKAHTEAINQLGAAAQARRHAPGRRARPRSSPKCGPRVARRSRRDATVWLFGHAGRRQRPRQRDRCCS